MVIKRMIARKEEKKLNPLKIMAVVVIGLIVIAFIISYISNRDSSFIDEEEVILVEPTTKVEGVDECKEYCIGHNAQGYDWEGDNCRCWFKIDENVCESQCDFKGADGFDWYEDIFKSDKDYCRCWFEMEGGPVSEGDKAFELWSLFLLFAPVILLSFFLRRIISY